MNHSFFLAFWMLENFLIHGWPEWDFPGFILECLLYIVSSCLAQVYLYLEFFKQCQCWRLFVLYREMRYYICFFPSDLQVAVLGKNTYNNQSVIFSYKQCSVLFGFRLGILMTWKRRVVMMQSENLLSMFTSTRRNVCTLIRRSGTCWHCLSFLGCQPSLACFT